MMGRIYESAEKVVVWLGGLPAEVGRDESLAIEVEEAHGRISLGQMPHRFRADGFGMEAVISCDAGCAMEAAWRGSAGAALIASSARCGGAHFRHERL